MENLTSNESLILYCLLAFLFPKVIDAILSIIERRENIRIKKANKYEDIFNSFVDLIFLLIPENKSKKANKICFNKLYKMKKEILHCGSHKLIHQYYKLCRLVDDHESQNMDKIYILEKIFLILRKEMGYKDKFKKGELVQLFVSDIVIK